MKSTLRLILGLGTLALSACDPGADGVDVKVPFGNVTPTTRFVLTGTMPFVTTNTFYSGSIGTTEAHGRTYQRFRVGYDIASPAELNETTKGTEFVVQLPTPDTFVIGGFEDVSVMVGVLDAPLEINLAPPVGVPQAVSASGVLTPVEGEGKAASGTATYTLIDDDETVVTNLGVVSGCRHFTAAGSLTGDAIPAPLQGVEITGDIWYHPDLGVVKWDLPIVNAGMDLDSVIDQGDTSGDSNSIRQVGVVSAETGSVFELDTYDVHNAFDATKMQHARMLLELRWADEEWAKTGSAPAYPGVNIEFGTAWGIFGYELVESPVSIFHPEENGKGYKYWYAYVDEAAKNEPGADGIAYHVRVTADTSFTPALRCSARIYYRLYKP
jgi:hypothetical protein